MRIFWPVYLLVALAGVVLTWIMAPSFRDSVPEEMRASWSSGVASLKGVDIDGLERAKADLAADEDWLDMVESDVRDAVKITAKVFGNRQEGT